MAEYQEYVAPVNGTANKLLLAATTGLAGLVIGLLIAWFNALQNKGVAQKEMQDYVKEQKEGIALHLSTLDTNYGELKSLTARVSQIEFKQSTDERDFSDFKSETKSKMGTVADYLESQKTKK